MKYVSGSCEGEKCTICKQPATHKVAEVIQHDDPHPVRHELTAYVCCTHYQMIMGPAAVNQCANLEHDCPKCSQTKENCECHIPFEEKHKGFLNFVRQFKW